MYDHLPPRLAKYLAAIYTGTDVGEIERQDTEAITGAKIKAWRCFTKLSRWNNAHKREIAQLQNKLHDRRVEVKFLLRQLEDRNSLLKLKNQSIDDLVGMLHSEKRKARELKRQVDKLNEFADVSCRVNHEFDVAIRNQDEELADWYEYVQLLIAKLNKRDEKIEALEKQYKHKCRSNDALASMLYDRDCEFK